MLETSTNLQAATSTVSSVSVAGVDLPVSDDMKVLGVVLDRRLTFDSHVHAVASACNYHLQAIRHIRHLMTIDLDYCNALLYGAPAGSIQKLQCAQNTATRIVLQAPRWSHAQALLKQLHWMPILQQLEYKLAVLTYKTYNTSMPVYLSRLIKPRDTTRHLHSPSFFFHTVIVQTNHRNSVYQPHFPLICTFRMELLRQLRCRKLLSHSLFLNLYRRLCYSVRQA